MYEYGTPLNPILGLPEKQLISVPEQKDGGMVMKKKDLNYTIIILWYLIVHMYNVHMYTYVHMVDKVNASQLKDIYQSQQAVVVK